MIVVVMGVCGSGKTTVGRGLAQRLGCRFLDADDFHSDANVSKMARGLALTDEDRWPWLDRLASELTLLDARGDDAVLACSALKQAYRDRLAAGGVDELRWVYLKGDAATIAPRLALRSGHYMPPALLASQFAALEEPHDAIRVDIAQSTEAQVAGIARQLARPHVPSP